MNSYNRFLKIALIIFGLIGIAGISDAQKSVKSKANITESFPCLRFTDIGEATKPGSVTIKNDEIIFEAGGSDIWGTHDEFHFGYKKLKGDFEFSAQIKSLSAADKYTKAGIMARADLSDNSPHVYFQVFPDNSPRNKNNGGCEFQYRTAKGGEMKAIYPDPQTTNNNFNVAFPDTWVRLKRHGDVFESYFSNDNKNWKLYSSYSSKMPEELLVGLAVTSHNPDNYTKAAFASIRSDKK
jgi:regulation of enolase protein 1 (concanavalin A-like superfamily)